MPTMVYGSDHVSPRNYKKVALPLSVISHVLSLLIWPSGPLHHSCQTRAKTLRHLGQDSSALRSELSLGHFGTSTDLSGQFGPTRLVPKCPVSEVSWVRSVRNSSGYLFFYIGPLVQLVYLLATAFDVWKRLHDCTSRGEGKGTDEMVWQCTVHGLARLSRPGHGHGHME